MNLPLIGITSDLDLGISTQSISPGRSYFFICRNYLTAVEKVGGMPLLLPVYMEKERVEKILDIISGLIISGGGDLDPSFYNEEPDIHLGPINPERNSYEVMITQLSLERDLPILGICGGMQTINVVCGGSLFQDIYSQIPNVISHRQRAPRWCAYHSVNIDSSSKLYQIFKAEQIKVNSRHHQAVKTLGKNLKISATSQDNVIEAIESTVHKFVIGVQWHPEDMYERDVFAKSLFQAFVKLCREV